jgi:hypothetical protein
MQIPERLSDRRTLAPSSHDRPAGILLRVGKEHAMRRLIALCTIIAAAAAGAARAGLAAAGPESGPITLESLLKEMVDRDAAARFPDPAYTCKQFSSYDRKSKTLDDPQTWFANGDSNQYLRVEEVKPTDGNRAGRTEWVMADMDGPGAVVRIWSADPKGKLRVYIDGNATPAIEALMEDVLGGKWKVASPLSQEVARGWNLYLPIPYARHCKITSDQNGFYYHVNYRTYAPGTAVESLTNDGLDRAREGVERTNLTLFGKAPATLATEYHNEGTLGSWTIAPKETKTFELPKGPLCVHLLAFRVNSGTLTEALRSTVMSASFDGEETVWAPLGDFMGMGVGSNKLEHWWITTRSAFGGMTGAIAWPMPYRSEGRLTFTNLSNDPVELTCKIKADPWTWDERSMHFHASWHSEYPIHAYGGRGTKDWNYLEATGKGVYMGDALAIMNPLPEWWGEGDEKIYVDGETFPSHFGTGTEDYYGYAWSSPIIFQHPFHAQPRCDGAPTNTWGHTTVTRVRSLDAIPFTKSFKFDMEIWHWKECDEAYAATTYWYAIPGATSNRKPQPEEAAKPIPQPPPLPKPFKRPAAIECESMTVVSQSPGTPVEKQDMTTFAPHVWSGESQLWVKGDKPGAFVEVRFPVEGTAPRRIKLYATKSWDYGILRFTVNGKRAGPDVDLFSGGENVVILAGPLDLGVFEPVDGQMTLKAEVVGANPKALETKSYFGLDCVVLEEAK